MTWSRLANLQNRGTVVPLPVGGTGFVLCPLLVLLAAAPFGESGQVLAAAAAVVAFAVGLTGLRQLATGLGLPILMGTVAFLGMAAEVLGTLFEISGVAVAVPLVAAVAVVLCASRWRAGDLALIGLVLGLGFVVAYLLDNIVHDDNGSATDQAVPILVLPSIALAVWVLARTRSISRAARTCVVIGAAVGLAALVLAFATREVTFVVLAVPAAVLFGFGLIATGVGLIQRGTAQRVAVRPGQGPPPGG